MPSVDIDLIARVGHINLKRECASLNAADLPPKILEYIFEILRDEHRVTTTRDHGFLSSWIPATWVCRAWRAVALATPRLWSWIDINARHCDPEAIATLLARCGSDENLSMSLDGQAIDIAQACELVRPAAHRISHLSVCIDGDQAPLIEELLMHLGDKLGILQLYGADGVKEYNISLDTAQVPNLRTLSLTRIFMHPTTELCGLKDLTLNNMWSENGEMHAGEYVYGLLAVCPDLETLCMEDALPQAASVEIAAFPQIAFPNLRTLCVNDLAVDLPANLANFVVPPLASIHITARYDGHLPFSFETATVTGADNEADQEDDTVLPMDILPVSKFDNFPALVDTVDLCLQLGTPCCTGDIRVHSANWEFTVPTLEDEIQGTNRLPELLDHIFMGFPTAFVDPTKIVFLQLHIAQGVPEYDGWAELLAQFPRVVMLTIGGRNAFNDLVMALKRDVKLLQTLFQLTVCLAAPRTALTTADAKAFGAMLAERAEKGITLESLIVRVPEIPLNDATFHLASALVAYMAVRGKSVRVQRQDCHTCHMVRLHNHA
ncbi:hypothetical protein BD311DRAFT_792563 [Dichomitus squalens]|uniref:Uncharacterized protein n=1 Tax=Dichomitus squalens TaxID=114155 RepID=A0A4Q9M820_9APHY|nr:hypothetical protein BD311DRAFT_792563 [Dichomitus squalens]